MLGTPREVFNRAEELRAMGLDISVAAALMRQLREAGLPVRTDILTSKEAEEEIARAMTGKPGESYAPGHRPHS